MKGKKMTAALLSAVLIAGAVPFSASGGKSYAADTKIDCFPLGAVTMTDAYSVNAFEKEVAYLLSFDSERLLAGFRDNAGLSTNGAKRYDGWENSLIGGHTVGHYMTAVAQAYENPLATDAQKQKLLAMMKTLVDGMKICQQNSKGKPGFLWAATIPNRNNVEQQFDNLEVGKLNIMTEAWVPWYTMHKLIAGLIDIYNHTGYEPAKDVASGLGDWVYNRGSGWDWALNNHVLNIEYGGMNDCLYDLYAITGKETHAAAAHMFDQTRLHDKVLAGGQNILDGEHANTTIPKFIGALKRYQVMDGKKLGGETVDASRYLQYAEAFWDMVTSHHTYITGGNSEWEHFGKDDILDGERTNCNCETCNSYNMLKLTRALYSCTGDPKYMDYYENTYYNSILSSQNPESGMTTYFQPMATGYFKVYSSPFNHFWCCTGSGMENFTKLGDTVYMHKDSTLYVNIYQSSVLNWEEQGVTVTQESNFPSDDTAVFTVSGSGDLEFRFREPDWRADDLKITVNGTKYNYKTVQGYAAVSGSFKTGDVIRVTVPMEVKAYGLPDDPNVYAFKYGPCVLSAELGTADMKQGTTGMAVSIPADPISPSQKINLNAASGTVNSFMFHINDYLVKDPDSLKFTLKGTDANLTFSPHYLQYQQRYGIYWYFYSADNAVEEEIPRAKVTVTDTVQPGYGQYENDDLHAMDEADSVSVTNDSTYRYAKRGGHFSYRMAVDPDAPLTVLKVTYRKADNGKPICVTAGNRVLFEGELHYTGSADTYEVKYIIPKDVLAANVRSIRAYETDYHVIDIGFSAGQFPASSADESAKVCDFIYMTAVKPYYEYDADTAYFVDCGDQDSRTLSGSDRLGLYNSLTEQLYGADGVTGMAWGLIDDAEDQYNGSGNSKGLYTANTWPDERSPQDGRDKTASFRYTKNQYENDIARHIDYGFTLPNGTYTVETGFADPWSCSDHPAVYANYGKTGQQTLTAGLSLADAKTVTGKVKVTDGTLTLNYRSEDRAINVTYIKIMFDETDPLPAASLKGDVNKDGKVSIADAVLLQKWLLKLPDTALPDPQAADVSGDGTLTAADLTMLKRILLQ